jgi:alkyl sulfatase BDS1-like metallo-beta-lactamase superfamily hydrolase
LSVSGNSEPSSIIKLREKLADPSVQKSLIGFTKTVQFSFTDIKEDYLLTINDGKLLNLEKTTNQGANIVVIIANTLMENILDKTANPITSYMSGKLKIKGQMDDLIKLQKLLS